jgi:hypothetical protein
MSDIEYTNNGNAASHPAIRIDDAQRLDQYQQHIVGPMSNYLEQLIIEVNALGGSEKSYAQEQIANNFVMPETYDALLRYVLELAKRIKRAKLQRQQLLLGGGIDVINEIVSVASAATGANFGGFRIEKTRLAD